MKNEKRVIIVQVDSELKKRADEYAKRSDRSLSSLIRWLIIQELEKHDYEQKSRVG